MKIVHTADLHLETTTHGQIDPARGVSSRLIDQELTLDWILSVVREEQADLLVVAGDLLPGNRRYLTGPGLALLTGFLAALEIPVVIIPGNHDLEAHAARVGTVAALDGIFDNVHVVAKPGVFELDGLSLVCIPFPHRGSIAAHGLDYFDAAEMLGPIVLSLVDQAKGDTIATLAHLTVSGSKYSTNAQPNLMTGADIVVPPTVLVPDGVRLAMLGHIHTRQKIDRCFYPGAPLAFDFGDGDEPKGLNVFDLYSGKVTFKSNPHNRPFVTLHRPDEGAPEAGSFVRLVVDGSLDDIAKRQVAQRADDEGWTLVQITERKPRETRPAAAAVARAVSIPDMIGAFCKARGGEFAEHETTIKKIAAGEEVGVL